MPPLKDLTGQKFGKLTVVSRSENKYGRATWLCKCDCGNEKIVQSWNLVKGYTTSCGCIASDVARTNATIHGQSYTRLYTIWIGMKQRCYYKKHRHFADYGGRGIAVCAEWVDNFENFREWSLNNGYNETVTIDRVDTDGDYSPSNCRWTTYTVQNNNTRKNVYLTYKDETHTLAEWCMITGIPRSTLSNRLKRGWTIEQALEKR